MPRPGGIYSAPAGTKGVPNTTIQSAPYNAFVDDLVADANAPRPVSAGGTGATNPTDARLNLGLANAADVTDLLARKFNYYRPFKLKTGNYEAVTFERVRCDTTSAAIVITLPAAPAAGDTIDVDRFGPYAVVIARNGQTIEGAATDLTLDINKAGVSLVYDGATWRASKRAIA